jgi:hypothetical protein
MMRGKLVKVKLEGQTWGMYRCTRKWDEGPSGEVEGMETLIPKLYLNEDEVNERDVCECDG